MRRRDLLKGIAKAGAAGAGLALTGTAGAEAQAPTTGDLAGAERVLDFHHSPEQLEQMARVLPRNQARIRSLREAEFEGAEPALHFDPRLPGMRFASGQSRCSVSRGPTPRYSGNPEELAFCTVVQLSRLLRARKVTSAALTRMYLARLKRYDPQLHCVVHLMEERALEQAEHADREIAAGRYRGPLHGIPWGAKDLLATRGVPTTMGAKPYEHHLLDFDATVVQRLDAAGAVLLGKLSLGELAMGDLWFGGRTRNPWNPEEGSSGSSAGPASATAAGLVGFSIGSETLGSIVSPCVVNGTTGLRPTYGRISRYGAMTLSWSMDKLGPICRCVEDCALVLYALHGPDGHDKTVTDIPFRWSPQSSLKEMRVAYDPDDWKFEKEPAQARVYGEVLQTLRELGVEPKPLKLPPSRPEHNGMGMIISVEGAAAFQKLNLTDQLSELSAQDDGAWPNTFRAASTIPAADYLQALRARRRLQEEMAETFRDVDVFITPPFAGQTLFYTNLTGYPTVVTRCGMLEGKPKMVEFIGGLYNEAAALRLAHAYEQATDWHTQWPRL